MDQQKDSPWWAEVVGAAVLFAVALTFVDAVTDDPFSFGESALKGLCLGLLVGLVSRPYRRWLEKRRSG